MATDYEPDYFDLNDWVVVKHPELFAATKYLPVEVQFELWESVWEKAGKPDISGVQTVLDPLN